MTATLLKSLRKLADQMSKDASDYAIAYQVTGAVSLQETTESLYERADAINERLAAFGY